jgi:hypothetical protein
MHLLMDHCLTLGKSGIGYLYCKIAEYGRMHFLLAFQSTNGLRFSFVHHLAHSIKKKAAKGGLRLPAPPQALLRAPRIVFNQRLTH